MQVGLVDVLGQAEQEALVGRRLEILPLAAVLDARQVQRFKNEVQAAAMLQHQNIVPVYSVDPLLDAGYRLFGSQTQRRFNPLPGAMVVCANKSATALAPAGKTNTIWCAIALAIAEDREAAANLFIEDASDTVSTGEQPLDKLVQNIAKSIIDCGADQGVLYKEIFVGYKSVTVDSNTVGCALTCAPYVTLARNAIPANMQPHDLMKLSIGDWETALKLPPLPPYPREGMPPKGGIA